MRPSSNADADVDDADAKVEQAIPDETRNGTDSEIPESPIHRDEGQHLSSCWVEHTGNQSRSSVRPEVDIPHSPAACPCVPINARARLVCSLDGLSVLLKWNLGE